MNDDGIDIRYHLRLLFRRWGLVRDLVIVVVALTLMAALLLPHFTRTVYAAKAYLMHSQTRAQVVFDKTITTISQNDLISQDGGSGSNTRLNSLVALAKSSQIAGGVASQLGGRITAGELFGMVSAQSVKGTDLIEITAESSDPNMAIAVVNAWTTQYNQLANQAYADNSIDYTNVERQITEAKARHDKAQSDLNDFIRNSQSNQLAQRLGSLNIQLAYLTGSATKDTADIPDGFTSIPAELRLIKQVASWYQTKVRLQALDQNASALQRQIEGGGDAAALSTELTQIFLKTQALGGSSGSGSIPSSLQVQWSGNPNPQKLDSDVRSLVSVIENQIAVLDSQIKGSLQAMLPGAYGQNTSSEQLIRLVVDKLNTEMLSVQAQLNSEYVLKAAITQDIELTANTYKALVQKREEQNASRAFTSREVQVVSTATDASAKPSLPILVPVIMTLIAVVIGIMAIYIIEGLDPEMPTPTITAMVRRARRAL